MTDMAGIIEPRHARCNATVDMAYAFPFDGQGPLDVASQQSMIISVHESVKDSSSKFQQRCWGRGLLIESTLGPPAWPSMA